MFCRRTLAGLARDRQQYEAAGATVAAVTMGDPAEAETFCGPRAPGVVCLADPEQRSYRAFGLGQLGAAEILSPSVFIGGMRAVMEGHIGGAPVGDPLQMPGTFVVGGDGRVRLAYYSRTVADIPAAAVLLQALSGGR